MIYRIGCQRLRIANTNIYRDTSVLIPVLILAPKDETTMRQVNWFIQNPALRACRVGSSVWGALYSSDRRSVGSECCECHHATLLQEISQQGRDRVW